MPSTQRRKGYRWIEVDGIRWQWRARGAFDAVAVDGRRIRIDSLAPWVGDLERGRHKRSGEGIVTPALAAALIRAGRSYTRREIRDLIQARADERCAALRVQLAALPADQRCDPECPGWVVDAPTLRIQVCDDCATARGDGVTDQQVAQLPEARLARRAAGI